MGISDDEFDQILDGKLKGWENSVAKIDYKLASSKQRKQMKKRAKNQDVEEDLDDEEVDLGDIYDNQSDSDDMLTEMEGTDFNEMDGIGGELSDEEAPPNKK